MLNLNQTRFPSGVPLYRVSGVLLTKRELNTISKPIDSGGGYFSNILPWLADLAKSMVLKATEVVTKHYLDS